mgnify:CR=1 FL=1
MESADRGRFEIQASMEANDFASLVQALQSADQGIRIAAMQALGKLGDLRAVPILRNMLSDSDIPVRRVAARVLYRMVADRAEELLDRETVQHLLRFRAPEEILSSATAIRLFLRTLDILSPNSSALDIEHGDGNVVSGSPMDNYHALTFRTSGIEQDTDETVRHVLAFFEGLEEETEGWWTVGPARGAGIVAFRKGDRFGETLHELAIARIAPQRYMTLTTHCHYADWD